MLQKKKELYAVRGPFVVLGWSSHVGTYVSENKIVVCSPWSISECWPGPRVGKPRMFMKINQIVELT